MFIQRIQQKNLLLAQIKSASLHQQQAALSQNCPLTLSPKFGYLKTEKACKHCWLNKRAKNEFSLNPYKTGKNLVNPTCYCSLNVVQETLYQHKSSNLFDKNYDIPLINLQGVRLEPSLLN